MLNRSSTPRAKMESSANACALPSSVVAAATSGARAGQNMRTACAKIRLARFSSTFSRCSTFDCCRSSPSRRADPYRVQLGAPTVATSPPCIPACPRLTRSPPTAGYSAPCWRTTRMARSCTSGEYRLARAIPVRFRVLRREYFGGKPPTQAHGRGRFETATGVVRPTRSPARTQLASSASSQADSLLVTYRISALH